MNRKERIKAIRKSRLTVDGGIKVSRSKKDAIITTDGVFERRINDLPTEDNWNSYGGKPPSLKSLAKLAAFHLSPTSNGGVQISWDGEKTAVEFDEHGNVCCICWEK